MYDRMMEERTTSLRADSSAWKQLWKEIVRPINWPDIRERVKCETLQIVKGNI